MFKSYKLLHKTRMVLFTKGFNIPHPDIAYNVRYIKNPSLLYWTITYFIFLFFIFLSIWVFSRPMVKFEAIANRCLLHFLKKRLWTQPYDSHRVVIYKETPLGPSLRTRLKKKHKCFEPLMLMLPALKLQRIPPVGSPFSMQTHEESCWVIMHQHWNSNAKLT